LRNQRFNTTPQARAEDGASVLRPVFKEKTMELQVTEQNAKQFVTALWQKITDTGFNSLSKNDFYDYVLYLFNKYAAPHFLDENSNYENAVLLKVTEAKIKTSKMNIALKYKSPREREDALSAFLRKISLQSKTGAIWLDCDESHFKFIIEDTLVRMELENLLKTLTGTTLDYRFNNEKVTIEKVCFLHVIQHLSGADEGAFLQSVAAQLNNAEFSKAVKTKGAALASVLAGFVKDITVGVLSNVISQQFAGRG
jgi:hypothetical protein